MITFLLILLLAMLCALMMLVLHHLEKIGSIVERKLEVLNSIDHRLKTIDKNVERSQPRFYEKTFKFNGQN